MYTIHANIIRQGHFEEVTGIRIWSKLVLRSLKET